jgi:hypothetical protein
MRGSMIILGLDEDQDFGASGLPDPAQQAADLGSCCRPSHACRAAPTSAGVATPSATRLVGCAPVRGVPVGCLTGDWRGWRRAALGFLRVLHADGPGMGRVDRMDVGRGILPGVDPGVGFSAGVELGRRNGRRRGPRDADGRGALRRLRPVCVREGRMAGGVGRRPGGRGPEASTCAGGRLRPAGSVEHGGLCRPVRDGRGGGTGGVAGRGRAGGLGWAGETGTRAAVSVDSAGGAVPRRWAGGMERSA